MTFKLSKMRNDFPQQHRGRPDRAIRSTAGRSQIAQQFCHWLPAFCRNRLTPPIAVRPPESAIQPPISTIPCKRLYSSANVMLPFPMLTLKKSQNRNEGSLEGLRPRRHISHPAPCRLCTGGPLEARLSAIPVAALGHARTIAQRKRLSLPPSTSYQSQISKSFGIRTSTKCVRNSFRIRTSKTQDLKSFRIRTYEKRGEGEGHSSLKIRRTNSTLSQHPELDYVARNPTFCMADCDSGFFINVSHTNPVR